VVIKMDNDKGNNGKGPLNKKRNNVKEKFW
jgi:hypothetical protein